MSQSKYLTAPVKSTTMPKGIPYIISNEAAERFSFYGMRCILVVFMTQYMMDGMGNADYMTETEANEWYHSFVKYVYFTPIIGALIADVFLGKYRTILYLSIVYCLGHFVLALDETRNGLFWGLTLIAIGAGGIKPCVSSHVGDQFGQTNKHLLERVFNWFYMSINFGSTFSQLLIPVVLLYWGSQWAFGIPGVLMLLATIFFWMGRHKFVHIPPSGTKFLKECFGKVGLIVIAKLFLIYIFIGMFWALFDQTGSSWVFQAQKMDRTFLGIEFTASQIQAVNPIMVMILIPMTTLFLYPAVNKVYTLTPLRKICIGLFIASISFYICALVESWIDAGHTPNIYWHLIAYAFLTMGEILISITGLEFSYTQAPKTMKSFIMGYWFLSVSIGNFFAEKVNAFIQNPDGTSWLSGVDYFLFFAHSTVVTAILFIPVVIFYREKSYIHEEIELDSSTE